MIPKAFKVEILKITAQSANHTQTLPTKQLQSVALFKQNEENMIHNNIFSMRENMN